MIRFLRWMRRPAPPAILHYTPNRSAQDAWREKMLATYADPTQHPMRAVLQARYKAERWNGRRAEIARQARGLAHAELRGK